MGNEVYTIDVLISTGKGQGRNKYGKSTFYKKTDQSCMLMMKNCQEFYLTARQEYVCSFCAHQYHNKADPKQHMRTHEDPESCEKPKKITGVMKPMKVSADLAAIIGKKEASRSECIKLLWAYM